MSRIYNNLHCFISSFYNNVSHIFSSLSMTIYIVSSLLPLDNPQTANHIRLSILNKFMSSIYALHSTSSIHELIFREPVKNSMVEELRDQPFFYFLFNLFYIFCKTISTLLLLLLLLLVLVLLLLLLLLL